MILQCIKQTDSETWRWGDPSLWMFLLIPLLDTCTEMTTPYRGETALCSSVACNTLLPVSEEKPENWGKTMTSSPYQFNELLGDRERPRREAIYREAILLRQYKRPSHIFSNKGGLTFLLCCLVKNILWKTNTLKVWRLNLVWLIWWIWKHPMKLTVRCS